MNRPALTVAIGTMLPPCEIHISQELIDAYAVISGDFNPIHVDIQAATASAFGGTIAHGCIVVEPLFQSIARWSGADTFPPNSALRLRYRLPARPGDVIRANAHVASEQLTDGRRTVQIAFACINQRDELVIDGECDLIL